MGQSLGGNRERVFPGMASKGRCGDADAVLRFHGRMDQSTVTTIVDSFLSGTNLLVWQREQCVYSGAGYQWGHKAGSKYLKRRTSRVPLNLGELDVKWHWQLGGFGSCELPIESFREGAAVFRNNLLVIPYWLIVLPLTLISACLLVSKPRPSTQKKIDAPTANEGTTK